MSRAVGWDYEGTKGKEQKFPDNNAIRYAAWMTAKLAQKRDMTNDAVQAHLWNYVKQNLAPGKMKTTGDLNSVTAHSQQQIDSLKKMIDSGAFDVSKPFNDVLAEKKLPRNKITQVTDPYSNVKYRKELQELAEKRGTTIMVSPVPGHESGFGFQADMDLDRLIQYRQDVLNAMIDESGHVRLLKELGVPHTVRTTLGTWGAVEPNFAIAFHNMDVESAMHYGRILGEAMLQDATIAVKPKTTGQEFGVRVRKKDGSEFADKDVVDMVGKVNPSESGLNFTLSTDRKSLTFVDDRYFDLWDDYKESHLTEFSQNIKNAIGEDYVQEFFTQDGDFHPHTGDGSERLEETWDKLGGTRRSHLQRTSDRLLYQPIWKVYSRWKSKLGEEKPAPRIPQRFGGHPKRDKQADATWNIKHGLPVRWDGKVGLTHWSRDKH